MCCHGDKAILSSTLLPPVSRFSCRPHGRGGGGQGSARSVDVTGGGAKCHGEGGRRQREDWLAGKGNRDFSELPFRDSE